MTGRLLIYKTLLFKSGGGGGGGRRGEGRLKNEKEDKRGGRTGYVSEFYLNKCNL